MPTATIAVATTWTEGAVPPPYGSSEFDFKPGDVIVIDGQVRRIWKITDPVGANPGSLTVSPGDLGQYVTYGKGDIVQLYERLDPTGQEVDCQAVDAGTGTPDLTNVNTSTTPYFTPGIDDALPVADLVGFSNSGINSQYTFNPINPNTGNNIWLPLTPLPADQQDTLGGVLYEATWTTPVTPTDYYVDVIGVDNSNDGLNWQIYDNVWGFTTQGWSTSANVLVVNDYALPQKFFHGKFGSISPKYTPANYYGAKLYITDIDPNYLDPSYVGLNGDVDALPPAVLPSDCVSSAAASNAATPNAIVSSFDFFDPNGTNTVDAAIYFNFVNGVPTDWGYQNGLGVHSYYDGDQDQIGSVSDGQATWPLPNSQRYDIWRVLSRGPIPATVLQNYAPSTVQQPDITDTKTHSVEVANSCVLWVSPFTGDEFAANGTLSDPGYVDNTGHTLRVSTVSILEKFLAQGGRLFVEGPDVGWSLTDNNPSTATPPPGSEWDFYDNELEAQYDVDDVTAGISNDAAAFTMFTAASSTDWITHDAYYSNASRTPTAHRIMRAI